MIQAGGFDISDATDGEPFGTIAGAFPIASGLCGIVMPAEAVGFRADPVLSANAASGTDVRIFDAHFQYTGIPGGSDVLVERIRFEILDEGDVVSDPSRVVQSVRFENELREMPIDAVIDTAGIVASLLVPPAVSDGNPLDFSVYFRLRGDAGTKAFSVRINSAADVYCNDEVTGGGVSVEATPGSSFPFVTSRAALLAAATAESFSNYPNPFVPAREMTTVTFYLPEPAVVSLEIFTILGRRVMKLIDNERLEAGLHQDIEWDGRNGLGDPVLSGVYLMVMTAKTGAGEESFRRKVSVIR
jgi:hypothetical protein